VGSNTARAWRTGNYGEPAAEVECEHGHVNKTRVEHGRMIRCGTCAAAGVTTWIMVGDSDKRAGSA
jgi:hypothetical protein